MKNERFRPRRLETMEMKNAGTDIDMWDYDIIQLAYENPNAGPTPQRTITAVLEHLSADNYRAGSKLSFTIEKIIADLEAYRSNPDHRYLVQFYFILSIGSCRTNNGQECK
jgi:hypothetical protein